MTRSRLLAAVLGLGLLLTAAPAQAAPTQDPALALLEQAAEAGRSLRYSGLQFASAWREGVSQASVADVRHAPGTGSVVTLRPGSGERAASRAVAPTADLDPRLLRSLTAHYQLQLAGREVCAGRNARIVEARRLDTTLAGRFWVDEKTDLLVRREVYDNAGALVRSSAFSSLDVSQTSSAAAATPRAGGLSSTELTRLEPGWRIPRSLPGGLDLYDARLRPRGAASVLHLSYTDGLSTLSVFSQRGRLGSKPVKGFRAQDMAGAQVWATTESPQRVVWSGSGQVFTVLSDAPAEAVVAAVGALPHEAGPKSGFFARLGRGLLRMASWLNPFN